MPHKPKTVLITGCSTGIGRATAERLTRAGDKNVYATARNLTSIADLEDLGCNVLPLDITSEESMQAAVRTILQRDNIIDVLVNNAGYGLRGTIEETPIADVRKQFETNVFGLVRLTQLVLPGMRAQRYGRIINLSSMGGKFAFPGGGFYHGTKYAIEAISDILRFEVRGFGIDVAIIEPGLIKTTFAQNYMQTSSAEAVSTSGPYATYNAVADRLVIDAYRGSGLVRPAKPEAVAKVIERAINRRRPRTRYPVTISARGLMLLRKLLPDRIWDWVLKTTYHQPSAKRGSSPTEVKQSEEL